MPEKVQFIPNDGSSPVEFYVLGQTKLAGKEYLLVTDSDDGDGEALILRARPEAFSGSEEAGSGAVAQEESMYEIVEDDDELSAVLLMMRDSLEDLGIEIGHCPYGCPRSYLSHLGRLVISELVLRTEVLQDLVRIAR